MNYELILQLKEAGFPWKKNYVQPGQACDCSFVLQDPELATDKLPAHQLHKPPFTQCGWRPNLSELIEACGKEFRSVHRSAMYDGPWEAQAKVKNERYVPGLKQKCVSCGGYWPPPNELEHIMYARRGSTPEEAVARLWLKLNEK